VRKAVRIGAAIVLAYLTQSVFLPHLRVGGVMIDVFTITVFTAGFACGWYAGLTGGLLGALLLEALSGDMPGLITVASLGAGALGAGLGRSLPLLALAGRRGLEKTIRRFGPMVAVGLYCIVKEAVYVAYFYLVGVDLAWIHVKVPVLSGLLAALAALPLVPLLRNFMLRAPQDTFLAHRLGKRRERKENKERKKKKQPATAGVGAPDVPEGGTIV